MRISSDFDGGNIICHACDDPADIRLEIRRDANSHFYQWFHFRLTGARGQDCVMQIVNAGGAAYVGGWPDYRAVASYDRRRWFRVPSTSFDREAGVLTIRHAPERDTVWYAYFAPYSMERHADLVAEIATASPLARLEVAGATLDGQDIDLLHIGRDDGKPKRQCWVIARQHPGETMAEWWMEGFLRRLVDPDDALARSLLAEAVFHVVPNMNPDGSRRGHLRTNAAGANLNREWNDPQPWRSPEVLHVRAAMQETGVDFALDVHGDEALPYNFIAGPHGIPSLQPRQIALMHDFQAALVRACPDFQTARGYPEAAPGKADLSMCTNWIAETFGCLAMTLEMPFKDNADAPDPATGWSPERSRKLGAAALDAIAAVVDRLR
ncbi:MAG TPA: M14-type cytosolic carboxypeptidase [Stellaceae bacterium]|jgi:murein tripeptide amidase MpaA